MQTKKYAETIELSVITEVLRRVFIDAEIRNLRDNEFGTHFVMDGVEAVAAEFEKQFNLPVGTISGEVTEGVSELVIASLQQTTEEAVAQPHGDTEVA
jgi:hypothetical protein